MARKRKKAAEKKAPEPVLEPEPTVDESTPKTTEEKLLMVYADAPAGPMNIGDVLKTTGETLENLSIAWDRLYDQGKVPLGKFVKRA